MPICKERFSGDKLISRLCVKGDDQFDLNQLKRDLPAGYELSLVGSCDNCAIFPPVQPELEKEEMKNIIKDAFREILAELDKNREPGIDLTSDKIKELVREVIRSELSK